MPNLTYTYKITLFYIYCTICLIAISFNKPSLTSGSNQGDRIKVLIIGNADNRHAIEEAASLSLDLPPTHATSQQRHNQSRPPTAATNQSNASDNSYYPSSQQHSLSALTLNQRHRSARDGQDQADDGRNSSQQQKQTVNGTSDSLRVPLGKKTVAATTAGAGVQALTEIDMPRSKPSWLNVSSRYKITGSSIDEVQFMMPAEYYLRQAFDAPVLLKTKLGIIEGVRSIKFNKHLYTFLSVPYAKPPVEELRFKAPQPIERWEGVLQTTKWPPFCVQPSMTLASKSSPVHPLSQMMSEDCLYLNIWTPSLKFNRNYKRPVMVWIHGGAFQYGGISVDENDGSALALAGDLVVVTLNYRISAFGFLNANNKDNAPNNVGLLDQRLAMQWVQDNIKQFGGDPQQVTLFGESAGGHSVGLHMISPGSQPLFKRAILQSGVPVSFLRSYDVNSDNKGSMLSESISSVMMAKRLKCYNQTAAAAAANPAMSGSSGSNDDNEEEEATATTSINANTTSTTSNTDDDESNNDDNGDDDLGSGDDADLPILSDDVVECMRQKSSLEILKAMGAPGNAGFFPTGNDPKGFFPNGPIMDSFDPANPKIGPQKDYMIGTNTDEGTFMLHYGMPSLFPSRAAPRVSSIEQLKSTLQSEIERMAKEAADGSSSQVDIKSASGAQNSGAQAHLYRPLLRTSTSLLESVMPKPKAAAASSNGTTTTTTAKALSKEAEFGKAVGSLITDIIFLCPARTLAQTLTTAGRNVYFYLYTHRSSLTPYHDWLGVTHHDEVEFVFGRPLRLADVYSGQDIEMSQRLIRIWSHFAHTGQALRQFNVDWPKYGEEDHNYMVLQAGEASVGQRYHDRFCNIYDTVISVHIRDN